MNWQKQSQMKRSSWTYQQSPDRKKSPSEVELVPNYAALRAGDRRNTHHAVPVNSRKQTAVD
jgi:hypothetical protein